MLSILSGFFVTMMVAMVVENALFSRALATSKMLIFMRGRRMIVRFGGAVTLITVLASLLSWAANKVTRAAGLNLQLRSVVFLCCICAVYLALTAWMSRKMPDDYADMKEPLSLAAFNGAVFGSLILSAMQNYSLLNTLAYGLGTGVGLTVAMILVFVGRQNIAMSNVPRAFRGLPILLVYIGILSLAIYGLTGHQLPS